MSGLRSLAERTRLRLKTRASKPGTWVRNPTFASSTSTFRWFFGWSSNSKKARINNCIFAQQGVLQALRPNSRDGADIRARGAEHNRLAPARSAVVQPVSSFHRFLLRLRGPNDRLKRTPEPCAIVIPPDLASGFTNARGAMDVGQFCFFSGHLSVFLNSRLQTYWRFGEFQWVAEAQIQSNSRFSKFLAFRGQHRPPVLRFVQFTAPSRHLRACPRPSRSFLTTTVSQFDRSIREESGHYGKCAPLARRQSNLTRRAHRRSRRVLRPRQNVEQLFPASEAGKSGEIAI
jgi:hypothetical protein